MDNIIENFNINNFKKQSALGKATNLYEIKHTI